MISNEDKIRDQRDAAQDQVIEGRSRWPGMTYEQGVDNALSWVLEETEDGPMEED